MRLVLVLGAVALANRHSAAQLNIAPNSLSFPNATIGIETPPQAVTVTNGGSVPQTLTTMLKTTESAFSYTSDCPMAPNSLAPQSSCRIQIVFTPERVGQTTAALQVKGDNSTALVSLAGYGSPILMSSVKQVNFGSRDIDSWTERYIKITNVGPKSVRVFHNLCGSSLTFRASDQCGQLEVGKYCYFDVVFIPRVGKVYSDTLVITDELGDYVSVRLVGRGAPY